MFKVTTQPASEPLSLSEVKNYLKVDASDDDALIAILISSAREYIEQYLTMSMITRTIDEYFDIFPAKTASNPRGAIKLTFGPLVSVSAVTYIDTAGDTQPWDSASYRVDAISYPPRITPLYGAFYPDTQDVVNGIKVTYVSGHTTASDIPAPIRQAMLYMIADGYEKREDYARGVAVRFTAPTVAKNYLRMFRKNRY